MDPASVVQRSAPVTVLRTPTSAAIFFPYAHYNYVFYIPA